MTASIKRIGVRTDDPANDLIEFASYFNTPLTPRGKQAAEAVEQQYASPPQTKMLLTPVPHGDTLGNMPKMNLKAPKANADRFTSNDLGSILNEESLKLTLEQDGIDSSVFGTGKAKTIKALLKELNEASSFLERNSQTGKIQRVVEPVFIQLRYKNLVLVEGIQTLEDGRERNRNMFLAEKKDKNDGGVAWTSIRGVSEELGLPMVDLQAADVLKFRDDQYCFEVEKLDSASYPGLPCIYRTHYCQLDILDTGLHLFAPFNLPAGEDFVTFETSALGTKKHQWRWDDVQSARKAKVKKFPPELKDGVEQAENCNPQTEEELQKLLVDSGIDTSLYGTGNAKTVKALLKEIKEGASIMETSPTTGKVQRVVEPVFIKLKFKDLVLVEVEQELDDGRTRKRNMLIAEKKDVSDANVFDTCLRGLCEELNMNMEQIKVPGCLKFRQDLYCCRAEHMNSASYPGLSCIYRTHYAQVEIMDQGLPLFKDLGLPDGTPFETVEKGKKIKWQWYDVTLAAQNKIKGYLESKGLQADANLDVSAPETVDALKALLKDDGVNVALWGVGKAKTVAALFLEISSGTCVLERSPKTMRLIRVVEPAFIAFKWRGEKLVQVSEDLEDPVIEKRRKSAVGCFVEDSKKAQQLVRRKSQEREPGENDSPGNVRFREDLNCFEIENYESVVYPDLQCVYRTKYVQLEQRQEEDDEQQAEQHRRPSICA